jgi:hypothetical protein
MSEQLIESELTRARDLGNDLEKSIALAGHVL